MALTVRELVTRWGFDVDQDKVLKFNRAIDATKKLATATGVILGATAAAVGFFAKRAGDIEQVQIAFETMLGSAERGRDLFQQITKFAMTTPFQLTELVELSKRLLAFNFSMEEIIPTLTSLGNIAAGVGREKLPQLILALGQVRAATKLRGQEVRQFTEAGVGITTELARNMGKTEAEITDMVSKGEIGFEAVNQALINLTTGNGRFANLMIKQSKSFLGILSNLRDALDIVSFEIGFKLLPDMKALAIQVLEFFNANRDLIAQNVGGFFREIVGSARDLVDSFGGVKNTLIAIAVGFGLLLVIWKPWLVVAAAVLLFVQDIAAAMAGQESIMGPVIDMWADFFDTLAEGWNMVGKVWNKIPDWLRPTLGAALGTVAGAVAGPQGAIVGGLSGMLLGRRRMETLPTFEGTAGGGSRLIPDRLAIRSEVNLNVAGMPAGAQTEAIKRTVQDAIDEQTRKISRDLKPQVER